MSFISKLAGPLVFTFVLCFGLEFGVRLVGFSPKEARHSDASFSEVGIVMDKTTGFRLVPKTGWENVPGVFHRKEVGRTVLATNWSGGSRATSEIRGEFESSTSPVFFLGDSFTYGSGLNDWETYPWKVQKLLPDTEILNYAVGAYGTCQVLLKIEEIAQRFSERKPLFVYGFLDFHSLRSVADPQFVSLVSPRVVHSRSHYPVCKLGKDGGLIIEEPKDYSFVFPLQRQSALMVALDEIYLSILSKIYFSDHVEVTKEILLEIKNKIEQQGGEFLVLFLKFESGEEKASYISFFKEVGLSYLELDQKIHQKEFQLLDGHPNEMMNEIWAEQIVSYLKQLMG